MESMAEPELRITPKKNSRISPGHQQIPHHHHRPRFLNNQPNAKHTPTHIHSLQPQHTTPQNPPHPRGHSSCEIRIRGCRRRTIRRFQNYPGRLLEVSRRRRRRHRLWTAVTRTTMTAMVMGDGFLGHHLHVTVLILCDGDGVGRVMEEDQEEEE